MIITQGSLKERRFAAAYGAKFPKAAAKITDDQDELLAFYDYPAEHWVHLRTTNPIESCLSTVQRVARNVKRWREGDQPLRWTATGLLEAEQEFRRIFAVAQIAGDVGSGITGRMLILSK